MEARELAWKMIQEAREPSRTPASRTAYAVTAVALAVLYIGEQAERYVDHKVGG